MKATTMDTRVTAGSWALQTVVGAVADAETPFVVTLTFMDGYRAAVNLYDPDA